MTYDLSVLEAQSKKINLADDEGYKETRVRARKFNNQLRSLEIEDIQSKIDTRRHLKIFFLILLGFQNVIVVALVIVAYFQGKLNSLSLIFGVFISGTIAESVLVLKIIVSKTFDDIKYHYHRGREV